MTNPNTRYSDEPVEVGMLRYVGCTNSKDITAHVITAVLDPVVIYDEEYQARRKSYPYIVRPASVEEEAAYHAAKTQHGYHWAVRNVRF